MNKEEKYKIVSEFLTTTTEISKLSYKNILGIITIDEFTKAIQPLNKIILKNRDKAIYILNQIKNKAKRGAE